MRYKRGLFATLFSMAVLAAFIVAVPHVSAATSVHLTAAGDFGARATTNTVLDKIAELNPDASFGLGDYKYGDKPTDQDWCDYVHSRVGEAFPFEMVSGNHDSLDVGDSDINTLTSCLPNQVPGVVGTYGKQFYADFPAGPNPLVRVINVSPKLAFPEGTYTYAAGDARYNWVSNAIDSGRAKGAKWIIVAGHVPCYSVGEYNCPSAQKPFYDMLVSKKVDLYMSGHEHGYMRSHQLRSGVAGCTTIPAGTVNASCIADSDSDFIAGQGTIFSVVGTGGTPLRDINTADTEAGYFAATSGLNSNPTYGLMDLQITDAELKADFLGTSGGNFTDSFKITKGEPPANQPPTASFTSTPSGLNAAFNGSASSDPDGTIASYAWDFGDGSNGTGATTNHTYATGGTYAVGLTVTDNSGATNTQTQNVTVSAATPTNIAADAFGRTTSSGWGTADTGGAWTNTNAAGPSVSGGVGVVRHASAGLTSKLFLGSVSQTDVDMRTSIAVDKATTGSGPYVSVIGRRIDATNDYRTTVRFMSGGVVNVSLRKTVGGAETTFGAVNLAGTWSPNEQYNVRLIVKGTSPTSIMVKVWKKSAAEPTAWTLQATDSVAGLQVAGAIGFMVYTSSSVTNTPLTTTFDDLIATKS